MQRMRSSAVWAVTAIAASVLAVACGGGGGGGGGGIPFFPPVAADTPAPAPAPAPSPNEPCFIVPAGGKTAEVALTTTGPIPVSAIVATLTGAGSQSFEGQSYPTVEVRSRIDQITGSDKHQTAYMLPDAQFLPAGAVTHPASDSADAVQRYAYTYLRMSLEQLREAALAGKVGYAGMPFAQLQDMQKEWMDAVQRALANNQPVPPQPKFDSGLGIPGLEPVVPTLADFSENTPVKLLMLQRTGTGTDPMSVAFGTSVTELTLTNAGREDVTVGGTTHAQACKLNIAVRRGDFSLFASRQMLNEAYPNTPASPESSYFLADWINAKVSGGNAWFAPGIGLVKAERVSKK